MPPKDPIRKKKKRAVLSDAVRKEISLFWVKASPGTRHEDVVNHFNEKYSGLGITRPTVTKILKKSDYWCNINLDKTSEITYKHRPPKFPLLERALNFWVDQVSAAGLILTETLLKEKAGRFATLFGFGEDALQWSNGWVGRFKVRNGIKAFRLHGEANSAPIENLPEERRKLRELLSQYRTEDIYNADETGLFYRMAPNQTLAKRHTAGKKIVSF